MANIVFVECKAVDASSVNISYLIRGNDGARYYVVEAENPVPIANVYTAVAATLKANAIEWNIKDDIV